MNVISRTNEARCLKWHEACKWKCRLDESVCNNKQRWNEDKCRRECKELVGKGNMIKYLIGILAAVNVNVINHVMLENISIIKTLSVEKG